MSDPMLLKIQSLESRLLDTETRLIDAKLDAAEAQKERDALREQLAAVNKDRDNWKAHAISRGKRLRRMSDKFCWIGRKLEDEGDRVYFGSSNYADAFKEAVAWLNDFKWDEVMGEPENWDLLGALEKTQAERDALRAELAAERGRVKALQEVVYLYVDIMDVNNLHDELVQSCIDAELSKESDNET